MALWWPWGGFGWLKRSRFGQLSVRGVPSVELLCSLAGAIVLSRCRFGHSILPSVVHPTPRLPTTHFRGQQPRCHQFVTRMLITLTQKVLAFRHRSSYNMAQQQTWCSKQVLEGIAGSPSAKGKSGLVRAETTNSMKNMKKVLLASLLISLAAASASAAPLWYDVVTNYNLGCITTNSGGLWYPHLPGTITATDALVVSNNYPSGAAVSGRRLRINGLNSEYIMRLFDPSTTNVYYSGSGTILYASFIANANFVPAAGVGTYFATFNNADTNNPPQVKDNGFDFRGRISEIGATNVYPFTTRVSSTFQWGIANAASDPAQGGLPSILFVPIDAIKNIDYQIVMKYDIDNATATLWVNPASELDTANMAGPTSDSGAVINGLAGLLFRQRTAGGPDRK